MAPDAEVARRERDLLEIAAVVGDLLAGRDAEARARVEGEAPGPGTLLRVGGEQRISWFLRGHLAGGALDGLLPAADLARLEQEVSRRRAIRDRQAAGVRDLLPTLEQAGLRPILLKGLHLAARFPRVAARTFLDSDVLVPRARADDAERLLADLGWTLASRPLGSRSLSRRFTHGFDFVRGDLRVDLHWSLASHWSYALDEDATWGRSRQQALPVVGTARVLADEDVLLELLVSFFEDLDRGGGRLRSVIDLEAVLSGVEATIDWSSFWRRREQDRTAGPCAGALSVALSVLDAHERFPGAARGLASARPGAAVDAREAAALLSGSRGRRHAKRWAIGRYDCPRWKHGAWWLASLPFRLSVYGAGPGAHAPRPVVASGRTS